MRQANRLPQVSRPMCSCIHNTRHRHSVLNEQGNVSTLTCGQLQNTYEATKEALCLLQRGLMMAIECEDTTESSSRSMLRYYAWLHCFISRLLYDAALYVEDDVGRRERITSIWTVLFIVCSLINNIANTTFEVITAGTRTDKDTCILEYVFTPILNIYLRSKRHCCLYFRSLCILRKVNVLSVA
jgi:hypothetical protein